jgi:hypothetical protein
MRSAKCEMRNARYETPRRRGHTSLYIYIYICKRRASSKNLVQIRQFTLRASLPQPIASETFPSTGLHAATSVAMGEINPWSYSPSPAAAMVFLVLFAIATIWHMVIIFRRRVWYFIVLAIGGCRRFPSPSPSSHRGISRQKLTARFGQSRLSAMSRVT